MKSNFSLYKEGQYWGQTVSSRYSCRIIRNQGKLFHKAGSNHLTEPSVGASSRRSSLFLAITHTHTHPHLISKPPHTLLSTHKSTVSWIILLQWVHGSALELDYTAKIVNRKIWKAHPGLFCFPEIIIRHRLIIIPIMCFLTRMSFSFIS